MGTSSLIPKRLLYEFETQEAWLMHDGLLHGVPHMTRVFILQELICDRLEEQGTVVNRHAIRWAASVHDVGRLDDGIDLEHGRRSAEWMRKNQPQSMSAEAVDIATYIVHWHVPHDSDAPVMTTELKVLKDADGLDRVRLGDLDESYLRTDAARNLVQTARQLCEASLPSQPSERESFTTVLSAAIRLGLVSNEEINMERSRL